MSFKELQSGYLQVADICSTGEYLKKVETEQKNLNEKKKKKNKMKRTT